MMMAMANIVKIYADAEYSRIFEEITLNFIRTPKRLITDPLFTELSLSAKLLYRILAPDFNY